MFQLIQPTLTQPNLTQFITHFSVQSEHIHIVCKPNISQHSLWYEHNLAYPNLAQPNLTLFNQT